MALIRGFSRVEEDGKIAVPLNIRMLAGLASECPVEFTNRDDGRERFASVSIEY